MLRIIFLILFLFGCASQPFHPTAHKSDQPDAPDLLLQEAGLGDSRYQGIKGFEHVMIAPSLRWRIEEYGDQAGISAKKVFIRHFLQDACALNNQAVAMMLEQVAPELVEQTLTKFLVEHPELTPGVGGNTPAQRLARAYEKHALDELDEEIRGVAGIATKEEIDRYWQGVVDNVEESIKTKGRVTRLVANAPLVPFIYAWIWFHAETDDRKPHLPNFPQAEIYQLAGNLA